jgi:hypothetical protein
VRVAERRRRAGDRLLGRRPRVANYDVALTIVTMQGGVFGVAAEWATLRSTLGA